MTNFSNKKYPNNINTPIDIKTDNSAGIFKIKLILIRILDKTKYVIPNNVPKIIFWLWFVDRIFVKRKGIPIKTIMQHENGNNIFCQNITL